MWDECQRLALMRIGLSQNNVKSLSTECHIDTSSRIIQLML